MLLHCIIGCIAMLEDIVLLWYILFPEKVTFCSDHPILLRSLCIYYFIALPDLTAGQWLAGKDRSLREF